MIANTPPAPYFAVIFTSIRTEFDHGYKDVAQLMLDLASKQPGYLGIESARNEVGITVSYWADLASIRHWKLQADHQIAQKKGKNQWYKNYQVRIAKVERDYRF
jgi:heme-degrading monooxygenase HmoA